MPITSDISQNDTRAQAKTKIETILDWYYPANTVTLNTWGDARTFINGIRDPDTPLLNLENANTALEKINSLNNYETSDMIIDVVNDNYVSANSSANTIFDLTSGDRTGLATVRDADGVVKWVPHNLTPDSNDPTQWTSFGGLASSLIESGGSPIGTNVYRLQNAGVNAFASRKQDFVTQGRITVVFLVKEGTSGKSVFGIDGTNISFDGSSTQSIVEFDFSDQSFTLQQGPALARTVVTPSTDGWYFVQIEQTGESFSGARIYANWNTLATDNVLCAGMYAYRSDLGGMQDFPISRRTYSAQPKIVGTTGDSIILPRFANYKKQENMSTKRYLIEETRTNLINNSVQLDPDSTTWSNNGGLSNISFDTEIDGIDFWAINSTNFGHLTRSLGNIQTDGLFTLSAYIKKQSSPSTAASIRIAHGDRTGGPNSFAGISIVPDTGQVLSNFNTNVVTKGSIDMGEYWYVYVVYDNTNRNLISVQLFPARYSTSGGSNPNLTGTNFYGGIQLEEGGAPSSYIPTYGATATRSEDAVDVSRVNYNDFTNRDVYTIEQKGVGSFEDEGAYNTIRFMLGSANSQNLMEFTISTNSSDNGRYYVVYETNDTRVTERGVGSMTPGLDSPFHIAYRHTPNTFQVSTNDIVVGRERDISSLDVLDLTQFDFRLGSGRGIYELESFKIWANDFKENGIANLTA